MSSNPKPPPGLFRAVYSHKEIELPSTIKSYDEAFAWHQANHSSWELVGIYRVGESSI